jgi:hypothetical protein
MFDRDGDNDEEEDLDLADEDHDGGGDDDAMGSDPFARLFMQPGAVSVHRRRRRHVAAATTGELGDGSSSEEGPTSASGDADDVSSDERPCYVS